MYNCGITLVSVYRSIATNIYNRSYQKLLDAISYIGGIFQSILALFFFVQLFNVSYFQMKFAYLYFKCKEAKNYFFGTFLKQIVYNALYDTRLQPQWKEAEVRRKVGEAVVSLQDIIFISKRVQFLQKAINVLFQRHQLKALRLLKNKSGLDVLDDYKNQNFRDQFIYFLKRNKANENQQPKNSKKIPTDILLQERQIIVDQDQNWQSGQVTQNKMKRGHFHEIKLEILDNSARKIQQNKAQNRIESIHSQQIMIRNQQVPISSSLVPQANNQPFFDQIDEEALAEYNNSQSDILLMQDIKGDLQRLVTEAEQATGDQRSKRIYEQIERQFRQQLKAAIIYFDRNRANKMQQPIDEEFVRELIVP